MFQKVLKSARRNAGCRICNRGRRYIQDSKLPIGLQLAKRTHERRRSAGLRRAKLRPAAVPFGTAKLSRYAGHIWAYILLGLQLAERTHEADLRDASCGPPLPGGCGPHDLLQGRFCLQQARNRRFSPRYLQQLRLRSSRQPAAAPGRRAAFSRCSKARPSARLRAGLAAGSTALDTEPPPGLCVFWLCLRYSASAKCK